MATVTVTTPIVLNPGDLTEETTYNVDSSTTNNLR